MFKFLKKTMDKDSQTKKLDIKNNQRRNDPPTRDYIDEEFTDCADITKKELSKINVLFVYFEYMIDNEMADKILFSKIEKLEEEEIRHFFHKNQFQACKDSYQAVRAILDGSVLIFHQNDAYIFSAINLKTRAIQTAESETIITGSHDAFNEEINTNLSLIRRRVKSAHLKVLRFTVGKITKNTVYILYIQDIADQELMNELKTRIDRIDIDAINDVNMLVQLFEEYPNSPFPQFFTTERPDVMSSKLTEGKIVGLMSNSPYAFSAPATFFDFVHSPDDYNQRWVAGSLIRFFRLFAFFITVTLTAFYVSITTYHYEMVPELLLPSLIKSRSNVPFPPIIEALLMEFTIELLREAGARLPTKVGQTIGIVGGIVIGSASVEAGITSNILIIFVAISAISSFVIPSYVMSSSVRIIRFGFILMAGFLGNLGISVALGFLVISLTSLTSLKTPYLWPISPTQPKKWLDTIIRAPYSALINSKPGNTRGKK
ncbi:spore germination protein [Chengkuizengella axinellae]|uniref:Spore germination protein n=1 Tax=Chengkuizengella axinellae TaxID=3064388 RepID=A0ABT9J6X1_9BACL|nr:spore germination protein [Chengkuizengella sp. 2205SS18-9]MDP5276765.1 spore germination protein [Chengkuizengella sp. 2205SS18-9]